MPETFNSDAKKIIRKLWDKPLLEILYQNLQQKLFYLGLPDEQAFDILEWIEYIDKVVAFQCRAYPLMSDPNQTRDKITTLESLLNRLERSRKLSTYSVYDGYIEEVLLKGIDNSPNPKYYTQDDIITIYNLDYCNSVASPTSYVDSEGNIKKAYKFDAIKKLIDIQSKVELPSKKFIMFLTIHCSFSDKAYEDFRQNPPDEVSEDYIKKSNHLGKVEKNARILKAYVYYNLRDFFTYHGFVPEFMPVIKYAGDGNHTLLHFAILGIEKVRFMSNNPVPTQKASKFLNEDFCIISNEVIIAKSEEEKTIPRLFNLEKRLTNSKFYKENFTPAQ